MEIFALFSVIKWEWDNLGQGWTASSIHGQDRPKQRKRDASLSVPPLSAPCSLGFVSPAIN